MNRRFEIGDCFVIDGDICEVKGIDKGYYICNVAFESCSFLKNILIRYADKQAEKLPF